MTSAPPRPFTGAEFLESLRGPREVWIYGERVADVTAHPAFRNPARMLARLYDALAEFGGRHELYERNYAGAAETIRVVTWQMAHASGQAERYKGFAEQCMAEYDLEGWIAPDLITPTDVNLFLGKRGSGPP